MIVGDIGGRKGAGTNGNKARDLTAAKARPPEPFWFCADGGQALLPVTDAETKDDRVKEAPSLEDEKRQFIEHAARIRMTGGLGRSSQLLRLFDFLVAHAFDERAPKELEIAGEIFGKNMVDFSNADATVRVFAHRLRKKLERCQANGAGMQLVLPRGEYRLMLAAGRDFAQLAKSEADIPNDAEVSPMPNRRQAIGRLAIGGAAVLAGAGLFKLGQMSARARDPRATGFFWSSLTRANRPTLILAGDNPMASKGSAHRGQLARAEEAAPADLDGGTPAVMPVSIATALTVISPIVHEAVAGHTHPLQTLAMSAFTPDMMNSTNLIYVGLLSHMGALQGPLFYHSSYVLDAPNHRLTDKTSGKVLQANFQSTPDKREMHLDYGYISSLPGPRGNRMLVIAGDHDPALFEMAKIACDEARLAKLAAALGNNDSFEAVFQVSTLGPSNVDSNLVSARPIKTPPYGF